MICFTLISNMNPKDDCLHISVQVDAKNYSYLSYVMNNFLQVKNVCRIVAGVKGKPLNVTAEKYATLLESQETNNSKIIIEINNSIIQSIGTQLAKYNTTKEVYNHLDKFYTYYNFAQQCQLELIFELFNRIVQILRILCFYVRFVGSISAHRIC